MDRPSNLGIWRRASEVFGSALERQVNENKQIKVKGDYRDGQEEIRVLTSNLDGTDMDIDFIDV